MPLWQIILLILAGGLILAIAAEAWLRRNRPRRPLAEKFLGEEAAQGEDEAEARLPLGMEAVDLEVLREAERGNRHAAQLGARDIPFWSRQMRRALQGPAATKKPHKPRTPKTPPDETETTGNPRQEKKT